jgi:hypothetical protein
MFITVPRKPGRKKKPPVEPKQIQGVKYLRSFRELLAPLEAHRDCPNRDLHYDDYVAYELLYFFTPVLTSMRGLQQASNFPTVQRKLDLPRFSLGAFSEAGRVFDPKELWPILTQLSQEVAALQVNPRFPYLDRRPTIVDGSLLHALPRMLWALWVDDEHRAAKVHLEYDLLAEAPAFATLTDGQGNERTVLRDRLAAGRLYLLDAGYADYALLAAILDAASSFLVRVRTCSVYQVLEERPVTEAAARAGVVEDLVVRLGSEDNAELHPHRLRLLKLSVPDTDALLGRRHTGRYARSRRQAAPGTHYTLWLVTDLLDLDAQLVAELYRYRWEVELFFRWFKKALQVEHLLSQNRNGLTIMVYCALIAMLLVRLWTGRKPTKRTYEMVCFYFLGWVSEDELAGHIASLPLAQR